MQRLGNFYKEKILCRNDLITKELPGSSSEVKIEHNLFGWRLYSGKEYIECSSEYEARYLKVWREAMVNEIGVPKDEEFLKTIVPELEELKRKTDEVIEEDLMCVFRKKDRNQILYWVWTEITKYKEEEEDV